MVAQLPSCPVAQLPSCPVAQLPSSSVALLRGDKFGVRGPVQFDTRGAGVVLQVRKGTCAGNAHHDWCTVQQPCQGKLRRRCSQSPRRSMKDSARAGELAGGHGCLGMSPMSRPAGHASTSSDEESVTLQWLCLVETV
jgi:hypothetical protein